MPNKRAVALFLFLSAFWFAIAARLFVVQIWNKRTGIDEFSGEIRKIRGPRGKIYDRNGHVLAMNQKYARLFLDAKYIKNHPATFSRLSGHINISFAEFSELIKTGRRYLPLNYEFSLEQAELIRRKRISGVGFEERSKRVYPEGMLARNILGVFNENIKTGLEQAYNSHLSGKILHVRRQRDGAGRNIPEDFHIKSTARGGDLYLTIDKNIQYIAESAARQALKRTNAERVIIIVQDCTNGEILAMASKEKNPTRCSHPAVSMVFEPGSIYKLVTYAAALSEGVIKADELIYCENGRYILFGHEINDYRRRGMLTIRESFAHSSNIACAKISQKIGNEKLAAYSRNFGFGSLTGINIPGEEQGLFPRKWRPITGVTVSFGQGIGVTPLQIINAYSAVANGGFLLEPKIVLKKTDRKNRTVFTGERKVIRRVLDERVSKILIEMLGDAVEYGSGKLGAIDGFLVGGKTGTAQKVDPATRKYSKKDFVSSFVGILPLDKPRYVILVLVDSPKSGGFWGSIVAAPIFSSVASAIASYTRLDTTFVKTGQIVLCNTNN